MKNRYRNDLIKLGIFTALAVLVTISVIATLLDLKIGQPTASYHAIFSDASGLESGDVVRIAGVEVGKINGVGLTKDNQAAVSFSVDSSQHLTTTSTASIQFENLLGQRYLQISAGPPGGQPLHSGATIPESHTRAGLDLTSVFSGFQPLLAALNPTQVNELTGSIIAVLQGEGGAVANLVSQTATLTSNLAQRQAILDEVLDNLAPFLSTVNEHDSQLGQLIDAFDGLVQGLAGQRGTLGNALTGLSDLETNTSHLLDQVQPTLDSDIAGLEGVSGELYDNQTTLSNVIGDLPAFLNSVDKVSSSGNYLAVYVCDLTLHLSGAISVRLSPTVPQSPAITPPTGVVGNPADHTQVCT